VLSEVLPYLEVKRENNDITETIEVPNIEGLTFTEAKKILNELGLEVQIDENIELESIVVEQIPKNGIQINSNSKVLLK